MADYTTMTTAMVSLQWNPFSDYICKHHLVEEKVSKIHFSVYTIGTKSISNDFQFSKIDFKTEFEKK
jgi:hypothetical protein